MADEDHALQAQRLDHRLDVAGQAVGGPRLAALAGLAVPGLVEGDDAVIGGEYLGLVLPVLAVAAPAVQEDEGRVAPLAVARQRENEASSSVPNPNSRPIKSARP